MSSINDTPSRILDRIEDNLHEVIRHQEKASVQRREILKLINSFDLTPDHFTQINQRLDSLERSLENKHRDEAESFRDIKVLLNKEFSEFQPHLKGCMDGFQLEVEKLGLPNENSITGNTLRLIKAPNITPLNPETNYQ